jgi:hypothetical protein
VNQRKKTPQGVWVAVVAAGLLLVAACGWFVVVSPQRSKAADLKKQIDSTQKQIDDARALVAKAKNAQKVKIADIFRLTKAMPDNADEAGVLLDLNNIAKSTGIDFTSIAVDPSTTLSGYQVIPLRLEFVGNFYSLSDFLFRLRNLVDVHRGALDARGRLFSADEIALDEGIYKFPRIRAQIKLSAYVYGSGTPGSTAPGQSGTTAATTTPTTTPPAASPPAAAAPAAGGQ